MKEIVITKEELDGILLYLNDNPAKFSNPLINFFNGKINQAQQAEQAKNLAQAPPPPTDQAGPQPKKRGVVKKLKNIEVNGEEDLSKKNIPNG